MIKRLKLEKPNLTPDFIGSWEMEASICDQIIAYYEEHKEKQKQTEEMKLISIIWMTTKLRILVGQSHHMESIIVKKNLRWKAKMV